MSAELAEDGQWRARRCWRLTVLPPEVRGEVGDDLRWGHFADADDAVAAVVDCLESPPDGVPLLSASAPSYSGVTAAPGCCTALACGRCGQPLGDEDEDIHELHFTSVTNAREAAEKAGWRWREAVIAGAVQVCPACQVVDPMTGGTEPDGAREPGPDQLPLDGMGAGRFGRGDTG